MPDVLRTVSTRETPQSQPAGAATILNAAGGYVFGIDDTARVRRFLILGSEGGTYYTKAPELTRQNAAAVIRMAETNPVALVDIITEISVGGRAPRQNPAIFALAIAASLAGDAGRAYALSKLSAVCRTGTHLFLFAGYVEQFRGWGRGLKRAVADWYTGKPVDKLAHQAVKYRQREGWSHRDLLRLSRPAPDGPARDSLFAWMAGKDGKREYLPALVDAFERAQRCGSVAAIVDLIAEHNLSWEMLPDEAIGEPSVWEALIEKGVPQTALMRQLPRLTRLGVTTGKLGGVIAAQLADPDRLKAARVHPVNVLVAQRTYASGRSARGESTWTPTPRITDALDAAFYASYGAVEPTGKRILLACDVSGSMGSPASGLPITCREAVAALCLVTLNVERGADVIGFSDGQRGMTTWGNIGTTTGRATRLDITPRRRLDDVCTYMTGLRFGRTDCALPMIWAQQQRENYDAIWVLTDNETWFGNVHPHQALRRYREQFGPTRFGVIAMTATGTSIADPNDAESIDIAGFDSNVPQVISDFSAARF